MDSLGGSSRKRKLTDMGSPGALPEYSFPQTSNLHRKENPYAMYLTHPIDNEFSHQFENQSYYQSDNSKTLPTFNANFLKNGVEKLNNVSYNIASQSLQHEGVMPFNKTISAGEAHMGLNQQALASSMFCQTEPGRYIPLRGSFNTDVEQPQFFSGQQNLMKYEKENYRFNEKMPLEMGSFDRPRPVDISQQASVPLSKLSGDIKERSQEELKFEVPCGVEQNEMSLRTGRTDNVPNVASASIRPSVCSEQDLGNRPFRNEVQSGSVPLGGIGDKCESKEAPDTEKPMLTSNENSLSDYGGSNDKCGHSQKNDADGSLKPDENLASTVAEKLWDGTLQLSSSVTLTAEAFFKSGEKLLGTIWPEFIEVKGKVRLEAFEKYIQDLPRSRTRGLMVVSICWKEGSNAAGLTGLKDVARGYRKGDRVGFAHLTSVTDIYICPRSDTIITILAKHGFFKGMAVIDDKKDSLIGCVVWKKTRVSSNSAAKKTDGQINSSSGKQDNCASVPSTQLEKKPSKSEKESSQMKVSSNSAALTNVQTNASSGKQENSPAVSSTQLGAEKKVSPMKLEGSSQNIQLPSSGASENSGGIGIGRKNAESGMHHKLPSSSHHIESFPIPNIPANLSSTVGQAPINMGNETKRHFEEDDLPEYDFGIPYGVSATPTSHTVIPAKNNIASLAVAHPIRENPSNSGLLLPANQAVQIHAFPFSNEKQSMLGNNNKNSTEMLKKNNLFDDDDDDMPEWCPPAPPNQKTETSLPPSGTQIRGPVPTLQMAPPPPPPRPPIPPPTPADTRSAFSYQVQPPFSAPVSVPMRPPPPPPFPPGFSSSMGLNNYPALRPQASSSNASVPFQAPRGGWRP